MTQPGLRERKKQATRQRITDVAIALFAERGFESVPVADIAAAADVSPATVFNYFPAKEDLVYDGMAAFNASVIDAVRGRPAGTSVVAAFRAHVLQPRGVLADPDSPALETLSRVAPIVHASPSLQARERLEADRATEQLRTLLDRELGVGDLRAWAAAAALVGVTRGMVREVQLAAAEGRVDAAFAERLLAAGEAAVDVVERGLRED
ncbi:TetR/AcrR family transcriptional regulator [Nocardioides panacisoli]|uniref:TetR/AcrR family transcriptional regulator n=1 Tax=Nocardioides panacisoli TaxID=627624 RepID=A0ABP7IC56_9ACTN